MGKRKKYPQLLSSKDFKKLKTKVGKQIVGIFLLIIGIIIAINSPINGIGKAKLDGLLVGVLLFVFGVWLFASTTAIYKGKVGEYKVAKALKRVAKKYGGYVINDVIIPDDESGKTSQIDHILFSRYGIFVVETKNYSGYIYGNEKQLEWTQVLNYGKIKNKLYNPVKQNATHCYRLASIINNDNIRLTSIIVFVKLDGGEIDCSNVYSLKQVKRIISKGDTPIYDEKTVISAYNAILFFKQNKIISNKNHIKEIKQNLKDINNNICPRCGGQLVIRKYVNGRQFYGCSNYPNCTFKKNIK